jgi:hypothetical protein
MIVQRGVEYIASNVIVETRVRQELEELEEAELASLVVQRQMVEAVVIQCHRGII